MPAFWFSLKRSLQCKSQPSDVHDPRARSNLTSIQARKPCGFGCSRSVSNLRDVIHGSKRHSEKLPSCSPRSLGSSDLLNPITHEVVLSDSTCELKITGFSSNGGGKAVSSTFVGTLKPGTPGPGGHDVASHYNPRRTLNLSRKINSDSPVFGSGSGTSSRPKSSFDAKFNDSSSTLVCKKCFKFQNLNAVEAHHLSKHAVTELVEGDSSRKIVEIICRASWLKSAETNSIHIKRVLKVHNMQTTIAQFEEHREIVKIKAAKLPTRHPRCLADGNELLRFYGTTISCSLGMNGSSRLCTLEKCGVCKILRYGFSREDLKGGVGVFTASTSGRALEYIELCEDDSHSARKALLLCRVIAGRVHKPVQNFQEIEQQSGFDSLAGKVGLPHSNIEELYIRSPTALLPCFVVIC